MNTEQTEPCICEKAVNDLIYMQLWDGAGLRVLQLVTCPLCGRQLEVKDNGEVEE